MVTWTPRLLRQTLNLCASISKGGLRQKEFVAGYLRTTAKLPAKIAQGLPYGRITIDEAMQLLFPK